MTNIIEKTPRYNHTRKLLPEIEAAETRYWQLVDAVQTEDEYEQLTKDFNEILDKAIDALYEDTKDRNSKTTIEQIYKARGKFDTHFGIQPTKAIKEIIDGRTF
jgi:hypothetical protein